MKGAGGTEGGIWRFFAGLAMTIVGGYFFFDSIRVDSGYRWGLALYEGGGFALTGGMILVPLVAGIGVLFYNARNPLGWLLTGGSLLALTFGVIRSIRFSFQSMSLFNLLVILVLLFGGIGLFLSSLRDFSAGEADGPP
jgi:uncharacterized protein